MALIYTPSESHTRRALWTPERRARRALRDLLATHPRPEDLSDVDLRLSTGERFLARMERGRLVRVRRAASVTLDPPVG